MPRRKHRRERVQRRKAGQDGRLDAFRCVGCRLDVPADAPGTVHRNHCPHCLTSVHLDDLTPGDRRAGCRGRMAPLSLTVRPDGEWMLIHHCQSCDALSVNRIAGDDNALALLRIAVRPLRDDRMRAGLRTVT
ncbi:RNHCP domain-containing protein [Actinomadura decatromicini]|uniref:RNHCP domain-containing protein n=1 Tax=Actinomadura decatromicini TaxID=2604572 RepID=A0A5D3G103_9ACTN|nr:RNHCP domain-containing protein [Actinomadura decatromicini]TYK53175.1 RNHCP domain-containing protein [Actinomadura decatromicini]